MTPGNGTAPPLEAGPELELDEAAADAALAPAPGSSAIEALRAQRDRLAANRTLRVPAPGLPGVELELRTLDEGARKRFAQRAGQKGADDETTAILALREAIVAVIINGENAGPLADVARAVLGRDPGSARAELVALWGDPDDPDAVDRAIPLIGAMSSDYGSWATGTDEETDAALLGQSGPTRP